MNLVPQILALQRRYDDLELLILRIQAGLSLLASSSPGHDEGELAFLVKDAVSQAAAIRGEALGLFASVELVKDWTDKAAFGVAVETARTVLAAREASVALSLIRGLADLLDSGQVAHHLSRRRDQLNGLRLKAVAELRAVAILQVRALPGPMEAAEWLNWFWSAGESAEHAFDGLRASFPSFADFLESVTRDQWGPGLPAGGPEEVAGGQSASREDPIRPGDEVVEQHEQSLPVPPVSITSVIREAVLDDPGEQALEADRGIGPRPLVLASLSVKPETNPAALPPITDPVEPLREAIAAPADSVPAADAAVTGLAQDTGLPARRPAVERPPPPTLPPDEASFQTFCESHWISPEGICDAAPWRLPGFKEDLTQALFKAMEAGQFGRALVFAAAAQTLAYETTPTPEEVEAWARLWSMPQEAVGLGTDGVEALRYASDEGRIDGGSVWKLRLCLEAIRPSIESPISHAEADRWVEVAGFASGTLRQMILLLLLRRATLRPVEEVSRIRSKKQVSVEKMSDELETKREEFRKYIREVYSIGSKVQRTHCRQAWDAFMSEIKGSLEGLYPPSKGGSADWDVAGVGRKIGQFRGIHKRHADKHGAKFNDRNKMDRTANRITELAEGINTLHDEIRLARQKQSTHPASDQDIRDKVNLFMEDGPPSEPFEGICRALIVRHMEPSKGQNPRLGLTAGDLLTFPALLGCVKDLPAALAVGDGGGTVPANDVVVPAAAAIFLRPKAAQVELRPEERLVDRLVSSLLPLRRYDLLAPLMRHIATADQAKVRTARNLVVTETVEVFSRLRRVQESLGDLAYPLTKDDQGRLDEAARRIKADSVGDPAGPREQLYLKGWLGRLEAHSVRLVAHAVDSLLASISGTAHPAEAEIRRALGEKRYGDAVFLKGESAEPVSQTKVARRQTAWRKTAHAQFADPVEGLKAFRRSLDQAGKGKADLDNLLGNWLEGLSGSPSVDQPLRTRFADVVFADTPNADGEQLRKQGKSEKQSFRIPSQKVQEYLARQGLNPSFIPQIARHDELVFITPPAKYSDPGLVQQTANLIAASHANNFVAVLAPAISPESRSDLLHELRQRKVTAAVIDSLDLCRLLNIGGRQMNLVVGLLEIMLEQQRWNPMSPFHAHDGAQARIEMYVGRTEEAKVLATANKYSRVFSGRKLGKSALLKFIEDTYDGITLPSGNTLRVLRIPIVGTQSDAMVISKVLAEIKWRLDFQPAAQAEHTTDAFLAALAEYLTARPRDSLLVILDEADVFVEKQLDDYAARFEQCLSFKMSRDAQSRVDAQGLPRVRFVFAGYRKTNTYDGAWGNWGDPLRLDPLAADEAADLIAGPLARLGIDAGDVAPSIAYRCGYQPAVLLRFGERLLDVLDDRFPDVAERGHVVVTPGHVAEVYQHPAVQDEIRTVVRNNFQGDDAGQAVFSATLLAFARLAPGDGLENAPQTIWVRLCELVEKGPPTVKLAAATVEWLIPSGAEDEGPTEIGLSVVNQHLEDFVERKLLVLESRDDAVYRLRFPYHLSSLLVGVDEEAWTALLRLGRGNTTGREEDSAGDPVTLATLRDLETVLRKSADLGLEGYRAAVLSSLWPQSVTNPDWLANRLGYDPGRLSRPGGLRDPSSVAFLEVSADEAGMLLASRPPAARTALLVGGADLLRWGLMAAQGGEAIEVQGQRRLNRSAVYKWFCRVREFTFDQDELEQIITVTGRIPYLVNLFDQCLQSAVKTDAGVHVGQYQFTKAKEKYDKRLPEYITRLVSGPDATRLAVREQELLLMVVAAGRATKFSQPVRLQDLSADWDEGYYEEAWQADFAGRPYPRGWADRPDDRVAAQVVADLGFLLRPLGQAVTPDSTTLAEDDPLVRVIVPALAKAKGSP